MKDVGKQCIRASVLAASIIACGCAAPPDLQQVEAMRTQPIQRYDNFQALASNGKTLVAFSSGGAVVRSADRGKSFERVELKSPASIVGAAACPDGTFTAADFNRKVWTGGSDGQGWKAHALQPDFSPLGMTCSPDGTMWVVGTRATILSSHDAGATWADHSLPEDLVLKSIQFTDCNHGVVTGEYGTYLVTNDSGRSWQRGPALPGEIYPYDAYFADGYRGWVAGPAGEIYATTDAGQTWNKQTSFQDLPIYAFAKSGQQLVGIARHGRVLTLDPQKQQWVPLRTSTPAAGEPAAIEALSPTELVVGGAGGTLVAMTR